VASASRPRSTPAGIPGTTSGDAKRIKELERENRELKRANEILLAASSFFARVLDPRLPW
jgi:transposase